MQIGGVLEVILLSIALGERVNEEKRQRILVEQRLASSLEAEVQKRTEELNVALSQLESANAILDQISHTDSLTQIANRRAFDSEMTNAYRGARRENHPLALIMLDIDHFKAFNDSLGHQAGDKALQEVSGVLAKHATRPGDTVFRYGGEEFAVLLKSTDLGGARVVAERMRISIAENRIDIDGEIYSVTISGGIAVYDPRMDKQHVEVPDHLILRADKCLYQAKEKGRNRIELEAS
jgi:diguanylate cyclase (GGDEF)-like protein